MKIVLVIAGVFIVVVSLSIQSYVFAVVDTSSHHANLPIEGMSIQVMTVDR
jgi:hypothetical protein